MKPDTIDAAGGMLGFLIGWLAERRLIGFRTGGDWKRAVAITIIALIPLYLLHEYFFGAVHDAMGLAGARFALRLIEFLYIFVVVPAALKKLNPHDLRHIVRIYHLYAVRIYHLYAVRIYHQTTVPDEVTV